MQLMIIHGQPDIVIAQVDIDFNRQYMHKIQLLQDGIREGTTLKSLQSAQMLHRIRS